MAIGKELRIVVKDERQGEWKQFLKALVDDDLTPVEWFWEQVERYLNPESARMADDLDVPEFLERVKAGADSQIAKTAKPRSAKTAEAPIIDAIEKIEDRAGKSDLAAHGLALPPDGSIRNTDRDEGVVISQPPAHRKIGESREPNFKAGKK